MRADPSRYLIRFFSFFGNLAGSLFIVWIVDETLLFQSGMPAGAPNTLPCACTRSEIVMIYHNYTLILPERQGESADKLHAKAAKFLPFIGLARSKRGLINRGHGANLYRPPPAGDLTLTAICCLKRHISNKCTVGAKRGGRAAHKSRAFLQGAFSCFHNIPSASGHEVHQPFFAFH